MHTVSLLNTLINYYFCYKLAKIQPLPTGNLLLTFWLPLLPSSEQAPARCHWWTDILKKAKAVADTSTIKLYFNDSI